MRIAIGTDHGGFSLKAEVVQAVEAAGHQVVDFGTDSLESVDYPDYAWQVGKALQKGEVDRGILLCGSGIGVCIAANKVEGVYASVAHTVYAARQGVEHDAMNVLCLGARVIGPALVADIVSAFLQAEFTGRQPGSERHLRRVNKVRAIENQEAVQ
jgi:ribose 5-phosphate isomerase B